MASMIRVSTETRDRVMRVAAEDYDGASADEALGRLLDEHWQAKCIAAVARYRNEDPAGWAEYCTRLTGGTPPPGRWPNRGKPGEHEDRTLGRVVARPRSDRWS